MPEPDNLQICTWWPGLQSTKSLILCFLLPGATCRYLQYTWQQRRWIKCPLITFEWPAPLGGGRDGIASGWSSWCPDGLVPTLSQYYILEPTANTCYATCCSQAKSQCLTWWRVYPPKNLGQQGRNFRLLLIHLHKCWGLPSIYCVWLLLPKYLHPIFLYKTIF